MIINSKISVQTTTVLLAALASVVLMAAMPSPAAAFDWSLPATDLSDGPSNNASSAQVVVAADGATTVVWERHNGSSWIIQARTRPAGSGTFGAVVDLSTAGQSAKDPQLAVGSDGAITVIWLRSNGSHDIVQARTRPAGSNTFSAAEDLSVAGQDAYFPQLAVAAGAAGATTVIWTRSNGSNRIVQARTRPAGSSTFSAAENLSTVGQDAYGPQLAVGSDGATTVVWNRSNGSHLIVQASTRPAGSPTFSAAVSLSAVGQHSYEPQVAVAAGVNGATTIIWTRNDAVSRFIQVRTRPAGSGTFSAVVDLSAAGQNAYHPEVAVAADGATTVLWRHDNSSSDSIIQVRTRPAGSGTFGAVVDLSAVGQDAYSHQLAVAADGATTVVWERSNGSNSIIQASTRAAGSSVFYGTEDLSAVGQHAYGPQVAVTVDGVATVVWERAGPTYSRIQESTMKLWLTLTKPGTGSGSVSSSPAGIDCGPTCSFSFNLSTSVTLTASPAAGSTFVGWSGACSGRSTCTVTMLGARSVNAEFAAVPPPPPPPPPPAKSCFVKGVYAGQGKLGKTKLNLKGVLSKDTKTMTLRLKSKAKKLKVTYRFNGKAVTASKKAPFTSTLKAAAITKNGTLIVQVKQGKKKAKPIRIKIKVTRCS